MKYEEREERIAWIEQASYEDLLRKWRREPLGSPWFADEKVFRVFNTAMHKKKAELSPEQQVQASKNIGWD